jgi:hypothetical protein
MWSRIVLLLLVASGASAQANLPASHAVDSNFIHQQFGDTCSLESGWPPMMADLNGDGVEDVVIVARCKNPLIDQAEKSYKVVDPMDAFFGYGDPVITTSFAPDDPKLRGLDLLVIHGAGPEAWRSPTPLAKYVIINLPLKALSLKKMRVRRKKFTTAIYVEEASSDQMTSAIFWDGRKYRYEPLGSATE